MIDDRNNQPVSSHRISITVALDRRIGKIVTSKRVERIVYNRKTGGRRRKKKHSFLSLCCFCIVFCFRFDSNCSSCGVNFCSSNLIGLSTEDITITVDWETCCVSNAPPRRTPLFSGVVKNNEKRCIDFCFVLFCFVFLSSVSREIYISIKIPRTRYICIYNVLIVSGLIFQSARRPEPVIISADTFFSFLLHSRHSLHVDSSPETPIVIIDANHHESCLESRRMR